MKISGTTGNQWQRTLFDLPLGNHGHVRTVIGRLAEQLTAALVGGSRHKTDSTFEYCPDASTLVGGLVRYYESKAVGLTRGTFIYEGRLRKDERFALAGNDLSYVIWHHRVATGSARTVQDLQRAVLSGIRDVYVVPFATVLSTCNGRQPEKLNSGYGGTDRTTYGSGYRLPLKLFDGHQWSEEAWGVAVGEVWNQVIGGR